MISRPRSTSRAHAGAVVCVCAARAHRAWSQAHLSAAIRIGRGFVERCISPPSRVPSAPLPRRAADDGAAPAASDPTRGGTRDSGGGDDARDEGGGGDDASIALALAALAAWRELGTLLAARCA